MKHTDSVTIGQPEYYKETGLAMSSYSPLLRYMERLFALPGLQQRVCGSLPYTFSKVNFEFNKLFSGATERKPRWKRIISNEQNVMGELFGPDICKKIF